MRAAWEKGKIERAVGYLRQNFWPLRTFTDLTDVNSQVRRWLEQVANQRRHRETGETPEARFQPETLRALPVICLLYTSIKELQAKAAQVAQAAQVAKQTQKQDHRLDYSEFIRIAESDLYDGQPGVKATLREIAQLQVTKVYATLPKESPFKMCIRDSFPLPLPARSSSPDEACKVTATRKEMYGKVLRGICRVGIDWSARFAESWQTIAVLR